MNDGITGDLLLGCGVVGTLTIFWMWVSRSTTADGLCVSLSTKWDVMMVRQSDHLVLCTPLDKPRKQRASGWSGQAKALFERRL